MKYVFPLVAIILSLVSSVSFAETKYSAAYGSCTAKASNDSDLSNCSEAELIKQDARLNVAYKSAITALPPDNQKKLRSAQLLWIKFRDADCAIYYSLTGGTMDMVNGAGCTLEMTRDRADSLEWFAKNGAE